MKNFFLSLRAIMLISREQNARQKLYNQQIKLTDFCEKHKSKFYDMKDLAEGQVSLIKRSLK